MEAVMDIKQLYYFRTIVNEGSLSAAARKLYMSQPPLSYQMKSLEQELGCSLFVRGNKKITLTSQGEVLYKRAETILDMLDKTTTEIKNSDHHDIIRIGVVSSIINNVTDLIASYEKVNDKVIWEIVESNTYTLLEDLKEQSIHFAFVRQPFASGKFKQVVLAQDKLVAIGNNLPETVDLDYLNKVNLIIYRRWIEVIKGQFQAKNLELRYKFLSDDARTCITLAKKNLGMALVPLSSVIENNTMDVREIDDCDINSEISMLYLPETIYGSEKESFASFVKKMNKK